VIEGLDGRSPCRYSSSRVSGAKSPVAMLTYLRQPSADRALWANGFRASGWTTSQVLDSVSIALCDE
jgi:hypothetical protein